MILRKFDKLFKIIMEDIDLSSYLYPNIPLYIKNNPKKLQEYQILAENFAKIHPYVYKNLNNLSLKDLNGFTSSLHGIICCKDQLAILSKKYVSETEKYKSLCYSAENIRIEIFKYPTSAGITIFANTSDYNFSINPFTMDINKPQIIIKVKPSTSWLSLFKMIPQLFPNIKFDCNLYDVNTFMNN